MKKIVFVILLLFTNVLKSYSYFDMSTPVEGNSIANDSLQYEVVKKIYETISVKIPTCSNFNIKTTQVLHYPYDAKKKNNEYVSGYWKELWTVDTCNQYTQIPVTFNIHKNKTTFVIDKFFLSK